MRGVFLALDLSPTQRDELRAIGFIVDSAPPVEALPGLALAILHDARGRHAAKAMRLLERALPDVTFAYQHLYLPAGDRPQVTDGLPAPRLPASSPRRVGLVDGGVDADDPALANALIKRHGCETATTSRHGTTVAARLVEGDPDTLYAADLWCGRAVGGATSNLIEALAWMARERVPVINISLVGPDNPVLARAVGTMIARGHVLVSAVGNDGPAAPALFPAAYAGVIGVSAVDASDRVLPESGSGEHVDFSALGIVGQGRAEARGTSFAAPIVARRAARLIDEPREGAAAQVQRKLAQEARDLGRPGRDPRYGEGLLIP
ncbi:MAG: S8 family serine peptidase [Thermomonas sp.]